MFDRRVVSKFVNRTSIVKLVAVFLGGSLFGVLVAFSSLGSRPCEARNSMSTTRPSSRLVDVAKPVTATPIDVDKLAIRKNNTSVLEVRMKREDWEKAGSEEAKFWDIIFKRKGKTWHRLDRNRTVTETLRHYLDLPITPRSDVMSFFRILVVGSGPTSDIGYKSWSDAELTLVLTDPLAYSYRTLWKKHDLYPPADILPLMSEELNQFFNSDTFDFVYSVNAMDHAHSPLDSLHSMLSVARPCRWVVVELWENEAVSQKGWGMHQWNFNMDSSGAASLTQWGDSTGKNVSELMRVAGASDVHVQRWNGCYLNGDCNAAQKTRMRMSFRKGAASGKTCPSSVGPAPIKCACPGSTEPPYLQCPCK